MFCSLYFLTFIRKYVTKSDIEHCIALLCEQRNLCSLRGSTPWEEPQLLLHSIEAKQLNQDHD